MTTRATATAMGDRVRGVAPDYKYYTAAEEEAKWVRKEAGGRLVTPGISSFLP